MFFTSERATHKLHFLPQELDIIRNSGGFEIHSNVLYLNVVMSWAAWGLALAQIPFFINFFWSIFNGQKVTSDNPWESTTLEWGTPTPPPHGNFIKVPTVYRGPYEYSVPNAPKDFTPQYQENI